MNNKALVLFSGGLDSTTCLAWALDQFDEVETVGFNYRQRHAVELDCRPVLLAAIRESFPSWGKKLGPDHVIDIAALSEISETALTRGAEIHLGENGLPTTFVPGRNLIFISYAAAVAYRRDAKHLVGGMCEMDFSGYPDCRDNTLKAMQVTLGLGMEKDFVIHTPLMWLSKSKTWELAEELGGDKLIQLIIDETHTCYIGDRKQKHTWGFGCGNCPACQLRREGWDEFQKRGMKAAS